MNKLIRKIIPLSLKIRLHRLKTVPKEDKELIKCFERNPKRRVLIAAYMHSGSTWIHFIILNYFNTLLNGAEETLTYDDLRQQNPSLPEVYRTHSFYSKFYTYFDKVIYLYRNPMDTLVSNYYYHLARNAHPDQQRYTDIDQYALKWLYQWIYFYKVTKDKADVVVRYEKLKENTYNEFVRTFPLFGFEVDKNILMKSIELSSFDNIKKMGMEKNQKSGMSLSKTFKGNFTRSGKVGQYQYELKSRTIDMINSVIKKWGIDE